MTDERFEKYLALKALDQIGGANTRELADDLAREWDGAAYVRVDVADQESAALREQLAEAQSEIRGILDVLGKDAIHSHPDGGTEDIYESLAISVAKLQSQTTALREQLAQLRGALEPLSQNGRLFTFHRNVEEGDYFECGLCHQEARRWNEIRHTPTCRIEIAKQALEATA